jgi:hypothetical protein
MVKGELLLRTSYHWKTLLLCVAVFLPIYALAFYFTASSFGGCAGCVPAGDGSLRCVNECRPAAPWLWLLGSYVAAYCVQLVRARKSATAKSIQ